MSTGIIDGVPAAVGAGVDPEDPGERGAQVLREVEAPDADGRREHKQQPAHDGEDASRIEPTGEDTPQQGPEWSGARRVRTIRTW